MQVLLESRGGHGQETKMLQWEIFFGEVPFFFEINKLIIPSQDSPYWWENLHAILFS